MTGLTREFVRQVANEEALRSRCTLEELLHLSKRPDAKAARLRAWARIIEATGCSGRALSKAWGCSVGSVWRAFPKRALPACGTPRVVERPLYDARTREHLRWAHGEDRAARIIAGDDIDTKLDVAMWRALGPKSGWAA